MEISQAGVFFYLEPIVGALVAIPLLGEKITLPFLAGTAFILLGIYIAEKRLPYQALRRHLNLKPTETKDA